MLLADGGAAYRLVRVQLASLQDYAAQLEGQITAMEKNIARLDRRPAWGSFGQARDISRRHDQALDEMRALLIKVQEGITIARAAAETIAERYSGADEFSRARLDDVTRAPDQAAAMPAGSRARG